MTAETIAADVLAERARQNAKWGEQNHEDGTGPDLHVLSEIGHSLRILGYEPRNLQSIRAHAIASAAKHATDEAAAASDTTWTDILLEEVFEALAEDDPDKLTTELVQVAAVAQQWVEAIDRRRMAEVNADRADRREVPLCGACGSFHHSGRNTLCDR